MSVYYFSFGQSHVHRIDGVTLDADVLLRVEDDDQVNARHRVFDAIGPKWHTQYTEENVDFSYFPRGYVEVPSI